MRTILEDLYYGSIIPNEQQITPGSELKQAVDRVTRYESQLMEQLEETEQEILTKLIQSQHEINSITALENFVLVRKRDDGRWEGRIVVGHKENGESIFRYVYADNQKELTAADLLKLYDTLKQNGRVKPRPGLNLGLSSTTVHGIHTTLHHALKAARDQGLIPVNPADEVEPPKVIHQPMKILTEEQLDIFLTAIKADKFWYDFFYTELTTGLRRGEICGLMWSDFDERSGILKVNRTLHREKGGRLVAGDTKTYAGTRKIVLPPSTAELLKERKRKSFSPWIFHDPLRPEAPMNPDSAYRQLKKFLAEAGLPNIRFHDLRHTFSTHALSSGVDAKTLAGILGHTKASFTLDTYTHTTGDMQKRAADIVGGFLTDYLGEEMKPWQNAESAGTAASA